LLPRFKIFWGFAPDPLGELTVLPPDPLAGLRGGTSRQAASEGSRGAGWEELQPPPPPKKMNPTHAPAYVST